MLANSKTMAFVATANPSDARHFYGQVLCLRELDESPFAIVFEAGGVAIRVQKVEAVSPSSYTVLGWEVNDMISTVRDLLSKGLAFEQFENLPQDELGIWATPDGSQVAWFKDPDGNVLSLTQIAPNRNPHG
ncbi:MAG: VOC family protein [Burkholderiaceae bacterium]